MAAFADNDDVKLTLEPQTSTNTQPHGDDAMYDPRDEEHQYQEVGSSHRVPTKTGEEDEMHVDSDRPGSAGTSLSMQELPEDEENFIASQSATSNRQTLHIDDHPTEGKLLSRPDQPSPSNELVAFMYGKAPRPDMDFQGTRRLAPRLTAEVHPGPHQSEAILDVAEQDHNVDSLVQTAPGEHPDGYVQDDAAPGQTNPARYHGSNRPNSSRGRKLKAGPHPGGPAIHPIEAAKLDIAGSTATTKVSSATHAPSNEIEQHVDLASACFPHPTDKEHRPMTPGNQAAHRPQDEPPNSPHSHLQDDLENAAQQTNCPGETHQLDVSNAHGQPEMEVSFPEPVQSHMPQISHLPEDQWPTAHHQQGQMHGEIQSSKRKKASRCTWKDSAPAARVSNTGNQPEANLDEYMQVLIFKIREECHRSADKVTAERDALRQKLHQLLEAKQILDGDFSKALQDNDYLSSICEKQKTKLSNYEARVKKFKTFVDGLGHDVDSLKREANSYRRKSEELVLESQACKADREALLQQMNSCTERSSQLKNEALKACSDTQGELQAAVLRANYLDQQLNEKVGLLAEERDRRAQLERHLLSAGDPSDSIRRAMKKDNDALVDKLHLLHATLESTSTDSKIFDTLSQVREAIQAASSQAKTNATDVALTKQLVEALGDRLSEIEDHTAARPLKDKLDKVLAGLKGLADHQEDRVRQDVTHREAMTNIQEKLEGSNARLAEVEGELQSAQNSESLLKEENQRLESTITSIQSQPSSGGEAQTKLDEMSVELQAKVRALNSANADLTAKASELQTLTKTNEELEMARQSLREKVLELEQTTIDLLPEKEAVEEQIRKEVERVREESLKHSQAYRAQLEMESKNQLRKLTSDRDRYEKQVMPLKAELSDHKKKLDELQKKVTENASIHEQLEQSTRLTHTQAKDIETLKSSLSDLQQSADIDASLKEKLASIFTDLDAEKGKLEGAVEDRTSLLKKADSYLTDRNEANKALEQAKAELLAYRADADAQLKKLTEEVKGEQDARGHAEAGKELFRKSCDAAIQEEKAKSRRNVEDLQTTLAQRDAELEKVKTEAEDYHADVEKQWQLDRADHAQKLVELRGQIEKAETAKTEALATSERSIEEQEALLNQIDGLKQRLASTEGQLKQQQVSTDDASDEPPRLKVPSLSEGITPSASERSTQPTRPRKKVDRSYNSTLDASALPVPEVLRPDSQRATSSKGQPAVREETIKDSQAEASQLTETHALEDARSGPDNFPMFSDVEQLQTTQSHPSHLDEVVEETQFDSLPSFAAFNTANAAAQAHQPNQMSSSMSMPYSNKNADLFETAHRADQAPSHSRIFRPGSGNTMRQSDPNFAIYEDSQDIRCESGKASHSSSLRYPNDTINWSQEERDKYTFRKAMPAPNSASKRVRTDSQSTAGRSRRASGPEERQPLRERRLQTPEVRGNNVRSSQGSAASSSPAYVQPTASRRTRTYSNTPADRQVSGTQTVATQDPRLAGRNPPPPPAPKRKAETNVIEGYEHERKKRLGAATNTTSSATPRRSLRSASQQSIQDLPIFPTMPANPKSSSSQSRLRTLGGGTSRVPGSKKMSKADEFGARFSQELR